MKWRWLLVAVPFVVGLLLAVFLNDSERANPLFRLLISLSSLLLLSGLLLSLLLGGLILIIERNERRHERRVEKFKAMSAEERRLFLSRLDHELKNPLMAMRAGLANFANAPTPELRQAALTTVEAQTVRLSRLTSDLRKIAELERRPLEKSQVNLAQLLNEVVELAREKPGASARQINAILPQAPWPLPIIVADWDLIFLAMFNLVDNAIKFSQPSDTIEIRGREDHSSVILEVADTGPGIGKRDLPYVWEELYRGEGGRIAPGSGLGLSLVRAIIERHGGRVSLTSKAGQGTIVTVQLPLEPTRAD